MVAGLEFGVTWRVPRVSIAEGVWSRSRKTSMPGCTSLAESKREAAGLLTELHLRSGSGGQSDVG